MKRVHAFEFEDQPWFPAVVRDAMTGAPIDVHCAHPYPDHPRSGPPPARRATG